MDRQILAAMHVKLGVCVCVVHERTRMQTRTQTLGPSEDLSGRIVLSTEYARGKILTVTPHAHWGTLMGATGRRGLTNVGSLGASLISGAV